MLRCSCLRHPDRELTVPLARSCSQCGVMIALGWRTTQGLEKSAGATAIGPGGAVSFFAGSGYEASTICSNEAWSMTWLLKRVASIKRSETWKWRAAAWMSSSPGSSVLMYA